MERYLLDIFPVLLFIVFFIKIKPIKPFTDFNEEYLSRKNTLMLKGVFSITVILHHLSQKFDDLFLLQIYKDLGTFAVSIFFFYSGYGLIKSYMRNSNYQKQFLVRRLPTVLFPYLIMCLIYLGYHHLTGIEDTFQSVINGFLSGDYIVRYSWFIINLVYYYIAFYISMTLFKKNYGVITLSCLLFCILYIYICIKLELGTWNYVSSYIFVAGMFWAVYEKKILEITHKFYYLIGIFTFGILVFLYFSPDELYGELLTFKTGLNDLLFVIVVTLFTMKFSIGNKILNFFGTISLEFYMTQGLMTYFFRSDFVYIKNDFLWCVAIIISSTVVAYILHLIFGFILKKYKNLLPQR